MTDFSTTCAVVTFTVKVICFTSVHGIRHSTLVTDLCFSVFPCVTLCYPVLHCGVTLSYSVVLPCVYPVLPCVPLCSPVNLVAVVLVVCQLSRDVIGYDNNKTMASNE